MSKKVDHRKLVLRMLWDRQRVVGTGEAKIRVRRLSGKKGKVFGIESSRRHTPNSSGSFARVHSAAWIAHVRNWRGSINSRSSAWRLSWSARQLDLSACLINSMRFIGRVCYERFLSFYVVIIGRI